MKVDAVNVIVGILIGVLFSYFLGLATNPENMIEAVVVCALCVVGVVFLIWYNKN